MDRPIRIPQKDGMTTYRRPWPEFHQSLTALATQELTRHAKKPQPREVQAASSVPEKPKSALWANDEDFRSNSSFIGYEPDDLLGQMHRFVKSRTYEDSMTPIEFYSSLKGYPEVRHLAKRYLCIPATNVPSESLWNISADISEDERVNVSGDLLEAQLMIRRNWQEVAIVSQLLDLDFGQP